MGWIRHWPWIQFYHILIPYEKGLQVSFSSSSLMIVSIIAIFFLGESVAVLLYLFESSCHYVGLLLMLWFLIWVRVRVNDEYFRFTFMFRFRCSEQKHVSKLLARFQGHEWEPKGQCWISARISVLLEFGILWQWVSFVCIWCVSQGLQVDASHVYTKRVFIEKCNEKFMP